MIYCAKLLYGVVVKEKVYLKMYAKGDLIIWKFIFWSEFIDLIIIY